MDRAEIRSLIRAVLAEELGRIQNRPSEKPDVQQETVRIGNDQELAIFVKRLSQMCRDETIRKEIERGIRTFKLRNTINGSASLENNRTNNQAVRFDKGFINERQIDALNEDTEVVVATRAVRFTPLAMDRLRQRGIRIERKAS